MTAFPPYAPAFEDAPPPSYHAMGHASPISPPVGDFELYDAYLKGPVMVSQSSFIPTVGAQRLATGAGAAALTGGRKVANTKVCDAHFVRQCTAGSECQDIHVDSQALQAARVRMTDWLNAKESEFVRAKESQPHQQYRVFCADLKEVVGVPISHLSFTRGLFVDPVARSRRARPNAAPNGFANSVASQAPTACGLYTLEPSQCKWGRWCNQAHIDHDFIAQERARFTEWSQRLEQQFLHSPADKLFSVHDPLLKQTMQFPRHAIKEFTRGLFQSNQRKSPSVCMLFQGGRCTARACCNQVHLIPEYLALARQRVSDGGPSTFSVLGESLAAMLNPEAKPFVPHSKPQPLQPVGPSHLWYDVAPPPHSDSMTPPRSPPHPPRGTPKGSTPKQNNPYADVMTPTLRPGSGYPTSPHLINQLGEQALHFSASPLLRPQEAPPNGSFGPSSLSI